MFIDMMFRNIATSLKFRLGPVDVGFEAVKDCEG